MFIKKTVAFFTSLKLTCVLLAFSIVLVFVGTLAQVDDGIYVVQAHYFKQWLVIGMHLFGRHIPFILPGGYLLGTLLLVNLVAAHIYRFQLTTRKIGIQLAHAGVILLLVGQLATDMFSRQMQVDFSEGQTMAYCQSVTDYELIFRSGDVETAIPAKMLKTGSDLTAEKTGLPFDVHVKAFWKNSDVEFRAPMMQNGPPLASNGIALNFNFRQQPPVETVDEKNIPTALIELSGPNDAPSDWVVSAWAGDESLIEEEQNQYVQMVGANMAHNIANQLAAPQSVEINGKQFTFWMRPLRFHTPFSLTLLKATHTVYQGTDIPKDFHSRVQLKNPQTGENREVEISMNHPLRYDGLTFYQYQMDAGQVAERAGRVPSSVLLVVKNPSWLTPYIGCGMVAAGLTIQFLFHLVGFISKRRTK